MRRQDFLEKTIMLENVEDSRKRGRPNTRWTDSLKEAIRLSFQELSRAVEERPFWRVLIHRVGDYLMEHSNNINKKDITALG